MMGEETDGRPGNAEHPHDNVENTATCGAILTENKLKAHRISIYNQGYKERSTESGRKGREAIELEPSS